MGRRFTYSRWDGTQRVLAPDSDDLLAEITDEVIHLFRAEGLKEADGHTADPDEFIDLQRMTLPEALQAIDDGRIVDAKTQVALLRTAAGL